VRPRQGRYGVYRTPARLDLNQVAEFKELTVSGGHLAPGCFPAAIALLSGVDSKRLVTAVRPLSQVARALGEPDSPRIKEVLVP